MSAPRAPRRLLPDHPSTEHLRKEAKRLAKAHAIKLAEAQHRLAREYGHRTWAALMRAVVEAARAAPSTRSPISAAAARGDKAAVQALLAEGAPVDGDPDETDTPLFLVCDSDAPPEQRLAVADLLIKAGAFTRRGCTKGATPLHAAARRGPAAMVELLLRNGAIFWQGDDRGARPYDYARDGTPADRDRILYLLADGPRIEDGTFRDAVSAIQKGDVADLARLLDARPSLLRDRAIEPDFGARGYFTDPKLFWFVANNPTLIPQAPANILDVAKLMIARGVEQNDLDYTLGLAMTNSMPEVQQIGLVGVLIEAGAHPDSESMLMSLGHAQRAPAAWLVERGVLAMTAPIAAGLGRTENLPALLAASSPEERTDALGMAVINREREAVRLCLEAGADPNRFMPCHKHSTPLHQAALHGDLEIVQMLVAYGARHDIRDTMWRGTPLGWAMHGEQKEAEAYLRALMAEPNT